MNKALPQRIQRKRVKGWTMPAHTVYVGRPTKWGNPFQIGEDIEIITAQEIKIVKGTQETCTEAFRHSVTLPGSKNLRNEIRKHLKGKNLACWCPTDQPCHADVLLKIANQDYEDA